MSRQPVSPADPGARTVDADLPALLGQAARTDETAFARVYEATAARAFGVSLRVLRDRAQAEEVLQDAYLHVWQHAARFDPARGSAVSWILMVVHGRAVDRVRSAEARQRRETTYGRGAVAAGERPNGDDTFAAVNTSHEAVRVRRALEALSEVQRRAIELAYFSGLTHVEVAERLDLPLGTAKARIRSGLARLRDEVGER